MSGKRREQPVWVSKELLLQALQSIGACEDADAIKDMYVPLDDDSGREGGFQFIMVFEDEPQGGQNDRT